MLESQPPVGGTIDELLPPLLQRLQHIQPIVRLSAILEATRLSVLHFVMEKGLYLISEPAKKTEIMPTEYSNTLSWLIECNGQAAIQESNKGKHIHNEIALPVRVPLFATDEENIIYRLPDTLLLSLRRLVRDQHSQVSLAASLCLFSLQKGVCGEIEAMRVLQAVCKEAYKIRHHPRSDGLHYQKIAEAGDHIAEVIIEEKIQSDGKNRPNMCEIRKREEVFDEFNEGGEGEENQTVKLGYIENLDSNNHKSNAYICQYSAEKDETNLSCDSHFNTKLMCRSIISDDNCVEQDSLFAAICLAEAG
ncbi:unnamed protein product, partial [Protopolystoma xenopodis]